MIDLGAWDVKVMVNLKGGFAESVSLDGDRRETLTAGRWSKLLPVTKENSLRVVE